MGLSSPWSGAPTQTTMLPNWQSRHLGCCATIAKKKPNDFDKAMPSTSHWFANAKILQCSIGKSVVLDAGIWHGLETCKFSTHLLRMIFCLLHPQKFYLNEEWYHLIAIWETFVATTTVFFASLQEIVVDFDQLLRRVELTETAACTTLAPNTVKGAVCVPLNGVAQGELLCDIEQNHLHSNGKHQAIFALSATIILDQNNVCRQSTNLLENKVQCSGNVFPVGGCWLRNVCIHHRESQIVTHCMDHVDMQAGSDQPLKDVTHSCNHTAWTFVLCLIQAVCPDQEYVHSSLNFHQLLTRSCVVLRIAQE